MRKLMVVAMVSIFFVTGCNSSTESDVPVKDSSSEVTVEQTEESQVDQAEEVDKEEKHSGDVVEIKEKMFVAQTTDIYINADEYLGKTIQYEGIFSVYQLDGGNRNFYSVIRSGPGCCGNDGEVGFEVVWDGEYPKEDEWVEVRGVLEYYDDDGNSYLRLAVESIEVLETRGQEIVYQ